MSISPARWLLALACLALLMCGVRTESAYAAKKKPAKAWPGKKKAKPHKKPAPAAGAAKSGGAAPPAEDAAEDDGDESAQGEDDAKDAKPAGDDAKAKPKKVATSEDSDDDGEKSDDDDGDSTVVRKKARKTDDDDEESSGGRVAFELAAGPRIMNRHFSFNDPLSTYQNGLPAPSAYQLPAGPAPFIQVGLYPAAFATSGFAANFGVVGSFEKLIGTKTNGQTTQAQQFEGGLRFRLPLGPNELGLTGSYGQQTFAISSMDAGPMATGAIPNVAYKFAGFTADARFHFAEVIELGLHVGTRLVLDTGALGKWFPKTKTNSINAGLQLGYQVTPLIGVVAGADLVRYGFDFNPVPMNNALVAGGAVDQYISGYAALRVTLLGS